MKIILLTFGKTVNKELALMERDYLLKTGKYIETELDALKEPSGHMRLSVNEQIRNEARYFDSRIKQGDFLVVLDEKGKIMTSLAFASFIGKNLALSHKRLVFVIGGPYGISEELKNKAAAVVSLSAMTFTHEMSRVILLEQIYRAFNINNHTPYHHI
jgi:23S rRNA (pseudouridine1915-N3)-methyltransferase